MYNMSILFLYYSTHISPTSTQLKVKTKFVHFPIQPTLLLTFTTSVNEIILPSTPHTYIKIRFNSTFNFLQVYQNIKTDPSSCSVVIQNVTHHSVILSPGLFD